MNRIGLVVGRGVGVVVLGFPWLFAACGGIVPGGEVGVGTVTEVAADSGASASESANGANASAGVGKASAGGGVVSVGCECPNDVPDCTCTFADDAGVGVTIVGSVDAGVTVCNCPESDPSCTCAVAADAGITISPPGCNCPEGDSTCVCVGEADAGIVMVSPPGTDAGVTVCGCPESEPDCTCVVALDAGTSVSPPPYGDAGVSSPPPPCPPGWQAPEGSPYLCCQTTGDGVIQCFQQAWGTTGTGPTDAGVSFGLDAATTSLPPSTGR